MNNKRYGLKKILIIALICIVLGLVGYFALYAKQRIASEFTQYSPDKQYRIEVYYPLIADISRLIPRAPGDGHCFRSAYIKLVDRSGKILNSIHTSDDCSLQEKPIVWNSNSVEFTYYAEGQQRATWNLPTSIQIAEATATSSQEEHPTSEMTVHPLIHPFCFGGDQNFVTVSVHGEASKHINIADCNEKAKSYPAITYDGKYITARYPKEDGAFMGYVTYKIIQQTENMYYVFVNENTGGSGVFSEIIIAQKQGSVLTIKDTIQGGDRCNGGIQDTSYKNSLLNYSSALTPYDIVVLTASTTLQDYQDLEGSAASCFGTANYSYNPATQQTALQSVSLNGNENLVTDPEWVNQYKYQACFNNLYQSYIKENKKELTLSELKVFNQNFLKGCVRK